MADSPSQAGMHVEWWPVARPKPYPKNARKLTQKAIEKVALSIKEFGWRQPIVCDAHDTIVIGHLRLASAQWLKLDTVPVHVAAELSPAKIRALRLMDNRSHEEFVWDEDLLREEMVDLQALGDLDLSLSGFDPRELDALLIQPDDNADECPDVPTAPVTRVGDLWLLGEHRLLCGDATSAADVGRLLDEHKPFLMVTDPPYGVEYDPEWRQERNDFRNSFKINQKHTGSEKTAIGKVNNDDRNDWSDAWKLSPCDVAYCWSPSGFDNVSHAIALCDSGFDIRNQIIWFKNIFAMSRGHYHYQHEPCWYAVRKGKQAHWNGDRKQTTVWSVPPLQSYVNTEEHTGHSTQKPVELMRRPIINHTVRGDSVYDPFLGSGTTIIAAESTERRCYGLEISPQYCDVIVARWQNFTHREATLAGHGATFAQVKEGRLREWEDNVKEECLEMLDKHVG